MKLQYSQKRSGQNPNEKKMRQSKAEDLEKNKREAG
jgi:hypothetical protein